MNVLFLTHRLPYAPDRGDRIRAYHLLRLLAVEHRVHLVSLVHDDEEAAQAHRLEGLAASVTVCRAYSRARGVAQGWLRLMQGAPLTHVLLDSPDLSRSIRDAVARHRPAVCVAYCSGVARLALEPALRDVPFVLDMVDADSEKWREMGRGRWPMAWVYRREARTLSAFEARAMRAAMATTVVNERERDILLRHAPDARVDVVPNGVDVGTFVRPGDRPPASAPVVVFTAVFSYPPNADAAMWLGQEIWPLVRERVPAAALHLVGSDPPPAVRALADSNPGIVVTGRVPDVRPYLWDAAVAAAPLRLSRGVQNKVLEAAAAGLPVVVTPAVHQGLPAQVAPACRVAASAAEMADALTDLLLMTPSGRQAMVGRAEMGDLAWARQLAPFLELLTAARRN